MDGWTIDRFSDVVRDGFGAWLMNVEGMIVAEVFASDGDAGTFTVSAFADVPVVVMEWFLREARTAIAHFSNGRPLPT